MKMTGELMEHNENQYIKDVLSKKKPKRKTLKERPVKSRFLL